MLSCCVQATSAPQAWSASAAHPCTGWHVLPSLTELVIASLAMCTLCLQLLAVVVLHAAGHGRQMELDAAACTHWILL